MSPSIQHTPARAPWWAIAAVLLLCPILASQAPPVARLTARAYDSRFPQARATYNSLSSASDGKIHYVLGSAAIDTGGQMYSYTPETGTIQHVGDLTAACGEKDLRAIPQGKSHARFVEAGGKLYFATHLGYYEIRGGRERVADPTPAGYKPYPGGCFLAYDLRSGKFEKFATAPFHEGILTMNMDVERGRLYGLTWPSGYFLSYDLRTRALRHFGPVDHKGEAGDGAEYRALCRSLAVDPRDGAVYWTTSGGDIWRYRYDRDNIEIVPNVDLRKDYFGEYDPATPGHMGYHWRQSVWYAPENAFYAVHGNSGYLFRFRPSEPRVDVIERITSEPSRRSGMFDQFYYGYLGFTLGPDAHTLYYLTGGPIGAVAKRKPGLVLGARAEENLHLITYHIHSARYTDHGVVFTADGHRPSHVNSIAVGRDGAVYALANLATRTDLIRVTVPRRTK